VEEEGDLPPALAQLGLAPAAGAIALVGGAEGMSPDELRRVEPLFRDALVPAASSAGAVVVDGGTDAGVMRLVGRAWADAGASFPLVGVVAAALLDGRDGTAGRDDAPLPEPHHTHFVLVPGSKWGDESPWLARVVTVLAPAASVTLLVNGGEIAWDDVERSVAAGRRVIAVEGSGRTADELAAAVRGDGSDPRAQALIESRLVEAIAWDEPEALEARLGDLLRASART
jgi:SLOG in TRPM, prokaryote